MDMVRIIYFVVAVAALSACASTSVGLYGAKIDRREENGVIAGGNIFRVKEIGLGYYLYSYLRVTAINGKSIGPAGDFIFPPGKYKISTVLSTPGDDSALTRQTALVWNFEEEIEIVTGHTYIPTRIRDGEYARVYFEDAGTGFRQECLPTFIESRAVNGDKSVQC